MEEIAVSKNGVKVMVDMVNSHAATHLEDTPNLKKLVQEVVSTLTLSGQEVAQHYNLNRIVGTCDLVNIDDNDEIIYGIRKNREDDGLVPFVKNREGDSCSFVSIHLIPTDSGKYILSSAWIGLFDNDEPFPLAKNANERSVDFWNKHAFVYGSQEIIKGSETKVRPW